MCSNFTENQHLDLWADTGIEVDGQKGGCLAALARLRRQNPHLRTVISVGGGGTGSAEFPALAAEPRARSRLAGEIRVFLQRWELDGVDSMRPLPPPPGATAHTPWQDEEFRKLMACLST
jgi:chitinase